MSREVPVRFCEGSGVRLPRSTRLVVGFQHHSDAIRFLNELKGRLAKFQLELHTAKTRLLEFGRFAATNRATRGERKPETFNFLGFTHICGRTRDAKFTILRHTQRARQQRTLQRLKEELRRRMHDPVPTVGRWLQSVLRGYFNYYGVPTNSRALNGFRYSLTRLWRHVLKRRSQRGAVTWERMTRIQARWLPTPRIVHPYPTLQGVIT